MKPLKATELQLVTGFTMLGSKVTKISCSWNIILAKIVSSDPVDIVVASKHKTLNEGFQRQASKCQKFKA